MRKKELAIAVIVCVATVLLYVQCYPRHSAWFPVCPLYHLTGIQCPFCGAQRMLSALCLGDISTAWHYNAFLVLSTPWMAMLMAVYLLRKRLVSLYNRLFSNAAMLVYLAISIVWMLMRNLI